MRRSLLGSLCIYFFTGAFNFFSFFSYTCLSPQHILVRIEERGEKKDQAFPGSPAARAVALLPGLRSSRLHGTDDRAGRSLRHPGAHCTPPRTHLAHSHPQFPSKIPVVDSLFIDGFVMLGFFFLLKMYPYTCRFKYVIKFSLWKPNRCYALCITGCCITYFLLS